MTIYFGLETLSSISATNIMMEFDCLEVINLLNNVAIDYSEVSFFIDEAKDRGGELGVVSFPHVRCSQNVLAHCIAHKVLEDRKSIIISTPSPEWFTLIMS